MTTTAEAIAPSASLDTLRSASRLAAIWRALATVPDPEIPVVSIVELGIVRDVGFEADTVVVTVTPTYSGCPATELILQSISEALSALDCASVRIDRRIAPPWTTDWIAPEAKAKLKEFGIAPPAEAAQRVNVAGISPLRRAQVAVPCPRCGSKQTTLTAQFGSTACKAQYRCEACLEPFDYFKPF